MHKCSSSTVQNILMRYGLENSLNFVLPGSGNYLGSPAPFTSALIPENLKTPSGKYNIFTHHSRWSKVGVEEVMYPGAIWVTILRHPATLYESLHSYYQINKFLNFTISKLVEDPSKYPKAFTRRLNNRVGINQMSWDLGLNPKYFKNDTEINNLIKKVDSAFDLVMISEFMEPSLVLLASAMNWPLERVASLKLNSRSPTRRYNLTLSETKALLDINSADAKIYNYYLDKFKRTLLKYGREKIVSDVERLILLNNRLFTQCVEKPNNSGYAKTIAYNVTKTPQCKYAAISELQFTDEIRKLQQERLIKMKQLYDFLN